MLDAGHYKVLCTCFGVLSVYAVVYSFFRTITDGMTSMDRALPNHHTTATHQNKSGGLYKVKGDILAIDGDNGDLTIFLNSKCRDGYKVPPLVHYVWLQKQTMEIHEYISVLSMSKFVKPCYILFHGDRTPGGKWWNRLLSEVHNIILVRVSPPSEIFGRKITAVEHKADVLRLQILAKYGGIYSDTDMYALRSFDSLRQFNITLGRVDNNAVANGIIVANKESVFLKIWILTYHTYKDNAWGDNSVIMASKLCKQFPSLVHVTHNMVMLGNRYQALYQENLSWDQAQYSVHLYARFFTKRDYEIEDLKRLDNTYGALSRFVLFGNKKSMA